MVAANWARDPYWSTVLLHSSNKYHRITSKDRRTKLLSLCCEHTCIYVFLEAARSPRTNVNVERSFPMIVVSVCASRPITGFDTAAQWSSRRGTRCAAQPACFIWTDVALPKLLAWVHFHGASLNIITFLESGGWSEALWLASSSPGRRPRFRAFKTLIM